MEEGDFEDDPSSPLSFNFSTPSKKVNTGKKDEVVSFGVFEKTRRVKPKAAKKKDQKTTKEKVKSIDSRVEILTIDAVIKNNFCSDIGSLEKINEDLQILNLIQSASPYEAEKRTAQKQKEALERRKNGIFFGVNLSLYLFRTSHLIERYRKLSSVTTTILSEEDESSEEINEIVLEYLKIAADYINLENFKNLFSTEESCSECKSVIFSKTDDGNITVCECGVVIDTINIAPSYNDSKRVNCSTRFKHNPKVYLEDAMDFFECKQGELPKEILDSIREQMGLNGLTPLNVTKNDIYNILTTLKLSDYYSSINAIYCAITGADPPDLSKYRNELLEMSAQFEPVCKKVVTDRKNALTVLWKLYMFLQLVEYPCDREDFYCLKTTTKQEEHQREWDKNIEMLMQLYPNDKTSSGKPRWRKLEEDQGVDSFGIEVKNPPKVAKKKRTGKTKAIGYEKPYPFTTIEV